MTHLTRHPEVVAEGDPRRVTARELPRASGRQVLLLSKSSRRSGEDAQGETDDETAHCSRCSCDLGERDYRSADSGGRARRTARARRPPMAGLCAPGFCGLSLWRAAAGIQLRLVPHAGLRRPRQHDRLARASGGVLLLVVRVSFLALTTALNAHQRQF